MTTRTSPVTVRSSSRSYQEYVNQQQSVLSQQNDLAKGGFNGPQLWRQMMIGFTCAGCIGLIMLVLGTIFIAEAVSSQQPLTVMLCVMGIVFGIIIIGGTIILGKLIISRKWAKCQGSGQSHSQCFHTCSIIYSPSVDQIGTGASEGNVVEPPPSYSSLAPLNLDSVMSPISVHMNAETELASIMIEPPKYEEVSSPLPEYQEKVEESSSLPPYKE